MSDVAAFNHRYSKGAPSDQSSPEYDAYANELADLMNRFTPTIASMQAAMANLADTPEAQSTFKARLLASALALDPAQQARIQELLLAAHRASVEQGLGSARRPTDAAAEAEWGNRRKQVFGALRSGLATTLSPEQITSYDEIFPGAT